APVGEDRRFIAEGSDHVPVGGHADCIRPVLSFQRGKMHAGGPASQITLLLMHLYRSADCDNLRAIGRFHTVCAANHPENRLFAAVNERQTHFFEDFFKKVSHRC
ncbi:hypothetical protein, partial [Shinella sp. M27]|uniref:hypothetical protein n=1 Tax=Shinella sp. M27 TaxID=3368614 RepID=UPI003BA0A931